jgi:starch synthase (maltosyl-transferring)
MEEARHRAVIENVRPQIDCGRFAIKRCIGDTATVEADVFCDGHDLARALLRFRHAAETGWRDIVMQPLGNDRFRAAFPVDRLGEYRYTVAAWADPFLSWRHDLARREDPADIEVALEVGARLLEACAARAAASDRARLTQAAQGLRAGAPLEERRRQALDAELAECAAGYPDPATVAHYSRELRTIVDPVLARCSAWYELFPRSAVENGRHGTFADCEKRLAYVAGMGFDVLYLPPIHPIGRSRRKGRNNALEAGPDDVGSPWAIGAAEGGHKAVHPALGTLDEFRHLVAQARAHGLEIALDIALQCAPDHPYVREHPEWFRHRPDGSIQYAENPPKKYQDIYPFDFECEAWPALWEELKSIFTFWVDQGVKVFRVDNPHTKPFAFWEWLIGELKRDHPELIFLSEAFTRPRVMHRLAKLGFTQSYTYFPWRNTRHELTEYYRELAHGSGREYLRPNAWPNTPDILTEYLQFGGRPAFAIRLVLAATLSANYGIYGPAFELAENQPREAGSEEYLDSEKYQIRRWDLNRKDSLREFIARVNQIRRSHVALQHDWNLRFYGTDNDMMMCYGKVDPDGASAVVIVVSLDAHHPQSGWVSIPIEELGVEPDRPYQMHDLLTGARYLWNGRRNFVRLDPHGAPAHVFRLRRRVRREQDFDYFL